VGRTFFVGRSARTSNEGIEQLRRHASEFGCEVRAVDVHGCLHLKSAVTAVGESTLLGNSTYVDRGAFGEVDWIDVDAREPMAANALWIGNRVIYPKAFVHTSRVLREHLKARKTTLDLIDASELAKAEGGVTCCCLILRT